MVIGLGALVRIGLSALVTLHPMHTSVTELSQDGATVVLVVRVFADDFGTVAPDRVGPDAEAYVRAHLELSAPRGGPVALRWDGATLSGDVVQIRLRADLDGLRGARVRTTLLCERFPDQVNIVRASYGGRRTSLLFTRGDQAKALP